MVRFYKRALAAMILAIMQLTLWLPSAQAVDSTVHLAGRPVFDILSSAGGYSATARAEIAQRNLDNALVATSNLGPAAVNVTFSKGIPVLTVGGYYVITVDNASAKAAGTSPSILAARMATALRTALADTASVQSYVAQLTGGERTFSASLPNTSTAAAMDFVHIPAGITLPVVLRTGISSRTANVGDLVQAELASAVTLSDGHVIPAGTVITGHVIAVDPGSRFFGGPGSMQVTFDSMQLSSGTVIPISASIVSGITNTQRAGIWGGLRQNTFGRVVTNGAVGAGLGAALGTAIGAIAGGGRGVGRGAWSGAAIGGGLGAISGIFLRPSTRVEFPAGQTLQLRLDAPAQVAVTGGYL